MPIQHTDNYGKPISEQLSIYLRDHTTKADYANVSILMSEQETPVSISTIRDVCHRANSLTKSNSKAIVELMRAAIQHCMRSQRESKEAREYFENELLNETVEI